ncbi:MAG TPA: FG-GAP-like repeat-containing protein [Terriglobia bacterium]|nr:FG-GAP-like repeat-containing protein [Terriglobia bacterium]
MDVIIRGNFRFKAILAVALAAAAVVTLCWQAISAAGQAKKAAAQGTATGVGAKARSKAPSSSASVQTWRNIGKAYYEQGKYPEALEQFRKVAAGGHALATDHLDLGLALMQAGQPNQLDEALGELTTARQMDPKLVAADYNLGILYIRELRYPDAEAELKRVTAADPGDPAAWFNLAAVYFAERRLPDSLEAYKKVYEMGFGRGENFYVAALFHMFTILTRLRQPQEAQKYLKIHEQWRDKVPNISLQNPALQGGKYGAILVPAAPVTASVRGTSVKSVAFADITAKLGVKLDAVPMPASDPEHVIASQLSGPSIAVGDYDGDGHPDLYLVVPAGKNHLLHNNGDGTFTNVTEKAGLAGQGASVSASFADYDNCGHPSLFVTGVNGVTLYHNSGDGTFTEVTEKAGLRKPDGDRPGGRPGELATRALLFDADNDGFLDLVVTVYTDLSAPHKEGNFPDDFPGAQSHFYRNNGDGTFSDITAVAGLASAKGKMRGAVFADFNNDGYADLLFFRDDGAPLLFKNQGEDKFVDRTVEAGAAMVRSGAVDAQVADFNHDGNFDLALWSATGYHVLLNRGGGKFDAVEHLPSISPPKARSAFRGTVADLNGDGFDDLLVLDANGKPHFVANQEGRFREEPLAWPAMEDNAGEDAPSDLVPVWLGPPGKLDLVAATGHGQLAVFEREGPPSHWLEVTFDGYKSNKGGVGDIVELKAGNYYKKVVATGGPLRVFTGDLAKLDVVRITWPNAVVQNTIDAATDKPILIRESERLASSCPFLYVWNGHRYVFFTDILGVAPLGELQPDGTRTKPDPEELVRLGELHPENGIYSFQITSEMREVDYVDQARLLAVDHPAAEEVYSNEIYSSTPVAPAVYGVREKHFPVSAVDDAGHDVLPLLREADGRYPTDFRRDRILGLADLHTLTLDLGDFADNASVALYLNGWVFWTDSNASRALMSNSKLQVVPPYLQVRDASGRWVTAIPDMGLPSGTRRTMRVDLAGMFPTRDHHLRIVTNLCVYWDQIFFTTGEEKPLLVAGLLSPDTTPSNSTLDQPDGLSIGASNTGFEATDLPLVSADLHYRGFSAVTTDAGHVKPDEFDYQHVMADAPWNPMRGNYTRYGAVEELLARADDRLVVLSTGDEIMVRFDGRRLPPVRPGWKRDFFLYVAGYAKDGEPNTSFSQTVGPMPFRAMSNYPYGAAEHVPDVTAYGEYLREYQTRPAYLLIPPLAPVVR